MPVSFQTPKRSIKFAYSSARLKPPVNPTFPSTRSEERRVGKEC